VAVVALDNAEEALGVNTREDLARVHGALVWREVERLMAEGVSVLAPERTTVEAGVRVGVDTVIHPGVCLLGHTEVGAGSVLHAGVWLKDCRLGAGVIVGPNRVLQGVEIPAGTHLPAP